MANNKRSHAGPGALDCNRDAQPALAAAFETTYISHRRFLFQK
jgi:hypothetical protein